MNRNRLFSGLAAVFYVVAAIVGIGGEAALKVAMFVILPLACIWFPDEMGGYVGLAGYSGITATSPGIIVCILGWVLLLLPLIVCLVYFLAGSKS
jgi:hypothetical protein